MAQFSDMVITNAGLDMIAASQAGGTLIFTKAKLGNGQLGEEEITELTDVISEKMEASLSSVTSSSTGHVEIEFIVDNTDLDTGFFVREIGIFAKVNETGTEQLYGYANAGNYSNYLSDSSTPIDAITVKIDLIVGDASEVSFTTDKSLVYVTQEKLEEELGNVGINTLKRNKSYSVGDYAYSPNIPSWAYLECTVAGTTGDTEPSLPSTVNETVTDGTATFILYHVALQGKPVGTIHESYDSTNPGTLWGGTWETFGAGRVLVAVGTADSQTYSVGDTGGSASVTLTTAQMPSHTHTATTDSTSLTGTITSSGEQGVFNSPIITSSGIISFTSYGGYTHSGSNSNDTPTNVSINATHTHTVTVSSTGSGSAHTNLQPYIAAYRFRRTA